jgi:O-antigen/teichoic acid export membrane protein
MTYYAEPVIRILFTNAYVSATPYFQVLMLLLLRNCFSFSTALRSLAHNQPFILANTVGIALNLAITLTLIPTLGLWAPTLGLLISQYWGSFYLARRVLVVYGISTRELLDWGSLWRIVMATAVAFAALLTCRSLVGQPLGGAVLGIGAFVLVYLGLLWRMRITEFAYLWDGLRRTLAPAARP